MAKLIWKIPVNNCEARVPEGFQFLKFGVDDKHLVFWAAVDTTKPLIKKTFRLVRTGRPFPETGIYWGSVVLQDGQRHIFEVAE